MCRCKACDKILQSTSLKSKRKLKSGKPDYEDLCSNCLSIALNYKPYYEDDYALGYVNNPFYVLIQERKLTMETN